MRAEGSILPNGYTLRDGRAEPLSTDREPTKREAEAEKILAAAQAEGGDLEKAAQAEGLSFKVTGVFKRNDSIPEIGFERDLAKAAFALTNEQPLGATTFKGAKGYYLISLKTREAADPEGFDEQQSQIRQRLLQQKQSEVYEQWLTDAKARSEIVVEAPFAQ